MEGYKPGEECVICKGKCCKEKGCSLSPEDMWRALGYEKTKSPITKEELLTLLTPKEGRYAIDYFSTKDGPVFYLRMRHKCYTFIGVDAMGECVALTEHGCTLAETERPKGGRFLKSAPNGACEQLYTREQMVEDWAPYRAVFQEIWKEYYARFQQDGTFEQCDTDYFAWMKKVREGAGR